MNEIGNQLLGKEVGVIINPNMASDMLFAYPYGYGFDGGEWGLEVTNVPPHYPTKRVFEVKIRDNIIVEYQKFDNSSGLQFEKWVRKEDCTEFGEKVS